ncbi:MAG: AAA family ATPase [Coleofasciculus sp. D1-CHI-01]|uniref:AAA family ATPase n=1 Tax=Coleofasciculus sp. D1-CHI-01 TaxID=3068482 RepID=UPI0032F5A3B5
MLKKIIIKNFKCFREETEFPLGQLTLLTGINGRGKSTMLQSLLLMRQSIEHNDNAAQLVLNGSCVHLGSFNEIRNSNIKNGVKNKSILSMIILITLHLNPIEMSQTLH